MKKYQIIKNFISIFIIPIIAIVLFSNSFLYAHDSKSSANTSSIACCPPTVEDVTQSISADCTCLPPCSGFLSLTEGNLSDRYDVVRARSSFGTTLDLSLIYNTSMADGYNASIYTTMGFGWTHSYNIYLIEYRFDLYLTGGGGRTTKFKIQPDRKTYKPVRGSSQKLVKNSDGTLSLTLKDGTKYDFKRFIPSPFPLISPPYLVTKITDRNGNETLFTYDSTGLLQEVEDTFGRKITFTYNPDRRISTIKDPLNRITTLAYNSGGYHLTKITDPAGNSVEYTYNSNHQITSQKDKNGHLFTYIYNGKGRPVAIRDGNGDLIFSLINDKNWSYNRIKDIFYKELYMIPGTTTKTDGLGNKTMYEYNENGTFTKITAPDGSKTFYTYDPVTHNVASETDCKGHTTSYEYDAKGNRTKVTDALGNVTTYTYDPTYSLVTSITDPDGDVTNYEYDAFGNLIREWIPFGYVITYTYDPYGNILTITACDGGITRYEYDVYGNRIKEIDSLGYETHYTYDIIGNMISRTDANGHTTTYEYDLLDRLVKETDLKGCIRTYTYDGEGNRPTITDAKGTTAYEYDLRDRLVKVTDAKGSVTSYTYDKNDNKISETNARGFITTYEYDSQNRLVKTTDAKNCITTIGYDCAGNKISEKDANGNITTYEYDPLNRLIQITDPLGNTTKNTYNNSGSGCSSCGGPSAGSSLIASITDANGKVTCYKYDELDRLIGIIRKVGDTDCTIIDEDNDAITKYAYDCVGNRVAIKDENRNANFYTYNIKGELLQECNQEGECIQYTYDPVGNKLTETRPNGNVITYTYDEKDQLITITDSIGKVASHTYDCVGNRITEEDGNNNKTKYEYDELNRLIKVTEPMNEFATYEYDAVGNLIKVTDRKGNQTSYTYDEINRRITVTDALGGVTSYEYDCMGNLIKLTDCNGNSTNYEYDPLNRLIKETYADDGTKEFTYDGMGNLITRKDQKGIITNYQYDELYRLVKRDYPGTNDDTFTYDKGGRMLTADNLHSAITFSYDRANRVTHTTQNGLAVSYTYDIANNKCIVAYPGGKVVKEEMDMRDRLKTIKTIKDAIDQIIAENTYDLGDRITQWAFLNTMETGCNYNQNDWITQLVHSKGTSTLIDFEYGYDKEGNHLYAKKNYDTSNSEKYTYDALYRLTEFKRGTLVGNNIPSPNKECTWTIDCVGNWLKGPLPCPQPGGCLITHNEVNEYTNICGVGQSHDNNGNLTDDGINNYEYDYENRLIKVTRKSDSVVLGEYCYDALSRRVAKEVYGVVTSFVYDDARVIEEHKGGSVVAEYVYGSWIDEVITMNRGGSTYYYHTNALGSIVALTDSAGDIVEHYRYDAYGKPEIFVDPGSDGTWFTADDVAATYSVVENPYLFTGRRLDEETELFYYRARYYDSERGRFLQRDPLEYVEGMCLFEYVLGNPINRNDAYGFFTDHNLKLKNRKIKIRTEKKDKCKIVVLWCTYTGGALKKAKQKIKPSCTVGWKPVSIPEEKQGHFVKRKFEYKPILKDLTYEDEFSEDKIYIKYDIKREKCDKPVFEEEGGKHKYKYIISIRAFFDLSMKKVKRGEALLPLTKAKKGKGFYIQHIPVIETKQYEKSKVVEGDCCCLKEQGKDDMDKKKDCTESNE